MNAEGVLEEVRRKYNSNPIGWRVLAGKDENGFPTVIFVGPDRALWEVKFDSLYKPRPMSVGMKLEDIEIEEGPFSELPYYGLRPIPEDLLPDVLSSGDRSLHKLRSILSRPPRSLDQLSGPVLHGPMLLVKHLPLLSKKQAELDLKLRRGLIELLKRSGISNLYT